MLSFTSVIALASLALFAMSFVSANTPDVLQKESTKGLLGDYKK